MRKEPEEPTPGLRECYPARKVFKPSVWVRLESRTKQTTQKKRTFRSPDGMCIRVSSFKSTRLCKTSSPAVSTPSFDRSSFARMSITRAQMVSLTVSRDR
ncbi:hypothetical protein DPMN_041439 [Dreissena polymorpha]|uniref:Uncharacterized protein n=1 Tax=Dreissena polymorpha TaxID=45954 RepID=A0A9D4HW33_DREPO|nr:hypothetical protein DPMN_041439 [Dreissena polymorpha]